MTAQVVTLPVELNQWDAEVKQVSWDWMTDSVNGAIVGAVTTKKFNGILIGFEAIPDPSGTTPTAAYTFTVKREDGVDILRGLGVGSTTATAPVYKVYSDGLGAVVNSTLTLAVAAAGNSKGGILNLFFA